MGGWAEWNGGGNPSEATPLSLLAGFLGKGFMLEWLIGAPLGPQHITEGVSEGGAAKHYSF